MIKDRVLWQQLLKTFKRRIVLRVYVDGSRDIIVQESYPWPVYDCGLRLYSVEKWGDICNHEMLIRWPVAARNRFYRLKKKLKNET